MAPGEAGMAARKVSATGGVTTATLGHDWNCGQQQDYRRDDRATHEFILRLLAHGDCLILCERPSAQPAGRARAPTDTLGRV